MLQPGTGGEQKLAFLRQREASAEIETCAALTVDRISGLVKDFTPEVKGFGKRILQEDAREPPVFVAYPGIRHVKWQS